jgi:hypothetical protein
LELTDEEIKKITEEIKSLADLHPLTLDEVDSLLSSMRSEQDETSILSAVSSVVEEN